MATKAQAESGLIQDISTAIPIGASSRRSTSTKRPAPIARSLIDKFPAVRGQPACARLDDDLIKAHADRRFRSEYDYALFEYYRSAKVIAFLERAGVDDRAAACSTPAAAAAACRCRWPSMRDEVVGIDPIDRFGQAGVGSRANAAWPTCTSLRADGMALPFAAASFDLVLSHAVIEHVADAPLYLRECRRVLTPGGRCLSVDGAVSVVCRRAPAAPAGAGAAASHRGPRRRVPHVPVAGAPRALDAAGTGARELVHPRRAATASSKHDDLLEKVTVRRLRGQIADAGLAHRPRGAARHGTVRRLPAAIGRWLRTAR